MKTINKSLAILAVAGLAMGWTACSSDEPETGNTDGSTTTQQTENEPFEPVDLDLTKQETDALAFSNTFSFNMFNAINRSSRTLTNKNIFISPLSIDLCLSMVANGATGTTLNELLNALGQDNLSNANALNSKLMEALPYLDNATTVKFANGIWAKKMFPIKDSFLTSNSDIYKAEIANYDPMIDDIVTTINQWTSDHTNGMINRLLGKDDNGSDLYVVDAVYFKGAWATKFGGVTRSTFKNYDGSQNEIDFIYKNAGQFNYAETNDLKFAGIPFGNNSYEFDLIVPKDNKSVTDIAESLNGDVWNELINSAQPWYVNVTMPRLDITTSFFLKEYLKDLGISKLFNSDAELSGITDATPFYIDKVIHKAAIKLDENGAEASAATITSMITSNGDGDGGTYSVIANHPYLFVIREVSTNTIVFIGAINQM
jgi:serpin B